MYSLTELLDNLPSVKQSRMVSSGYGLWMVWSGQLSKALPQTLEEHAGLRMAGAPSQALWFFSNREVFKALARLQIWSRLNPMQTFFQVLPASFLVGWDMETSVSVAADLSSQEVIGPGGFEALIHPKCQEAAASIPGLEMEPVNQATGLAPAEWKRMAADPGQSYESSLGWYVIIRPLGNSQDRDFVNGWRTFFSRVEPVLRRMGLKYLYNESTLIVPIESLRVLRGFCKDVIATVKEIKSDQEALYWPCVVVAVGKEGFHFNEDLPKKVNLEWKRLTPDYPHLSYRHAFLLGDDFKVNQVAYFSDRLGIDNWCYVTISKEGEAGSEGGRLQVELPKRMVAGTANECFYCGLKNHAPAECPSRQLRSAHPEVWEKLAHINLEEFSDVSKEVDEALQQEPLQGMGKLLHGEGRPNVLVQAMFENTLPFQIRMLRRVWRSRGKDWQGAFDTLGPEEGEFIWAAMEALRKDNQSNAETLLGNAMVRYPRSYQPRSLQSLIYMESGDLEQAFFYLQESERLGYTPVQRATFFVMQGRAQEIQFEFEKAISLYKQAEQQAKAWLDPLYRQAVCLVKMGFTEQAMGILQDLVERDPTFFNRIVIDPELDRGRFAILSSMWDVWQEARDEAEKARNQLNDLNSKLHQWFPPDHEFMESAGERVERLNRLSKVDNYVAYQRLRQGVSVLAKEMQEKVENEIRVVEKRVKTLLERLMEVQREASWFPFPKLLREFNRDFNFCVEKLNWMKTQQLQVADNFRKAQGFLGEVEDRLHVLQGRLVTLRVIRDATLFILLLGRNFIWMELVGLGLALVLVPLIVYLSQNVLDESWATDLVLKQKWQLQKGLVLVLSIVAMAAAALKTAIMFDRKKNQIFNEEFDKERSGRKSRKQKDKRAKKAAGKKKGGTQAKARGRSR
ncbi:tetratricopeptide repeat protein [Desulfohalovibrio reitneri]|uniref:tetratricopeptide repeat protein n=1 Tax=Desulfohalovibrio reitneri TaxID=1307759 RepID=UPI00054EC976|nr:hypothetical protein [Desulfohalovibrio reitneri]